MQALRDTKALYDEGILTEAEFRAKKAELLAAKAYGVAPPPPPPKTKLSLSDATFTAPKLSLSDATFTAPLTSLGDDAVPSMVDDTVPRFQSRRGLGSKRGWDVRVACDPEDAADICAVVNAHYAGDFAGPDAFRSGPGPTVTEAGVARQLESPDGQWVVVESVVGEAVLACVRVSYVGAATSGRVALFEHLAVAGDVSRDDAADVAEAALRTAESAARANGCGACCVEVPEWRAGDRLALERRGYAQRGPLVTVFDCDRKTRAATMQLSFDGSSGVTMGAPKPKTTVSLSAPTTNAFVAGRGGGSAAFEAAPAPAADPMTGMVAQLELASSLKGLCKMLDEVDDAAAPAAPRPPIAGDPAQEAQLEGLLSGLLASLKTDAGREEFDRLADQQRGDEKAAADAALAKQCPFPGFVPRPADDGAAETGTSVTIGDHKSFVELISSDNRFKHTGE